MWKSRLQNRHKHFTWRILSKTIPSKQMVELQIEYKIIAIQGWNICEWLEELLNPNNSFPVSRKSGMVLQNPWIVKLKGIGMHWSRSLTNWRTRGLLVFGQLLSLDGSCYSLMPRLLVRRPMLPVSLEIMRVILCKSRLVILWLNLHLNPKLKHSANIEISSGTENNQASNWGWCKRGDSSSTWSFSSSRLGWNAPNSWRTETNPKMPYMEDISYSPFLSYHCPWRNKIG